MPATLKLLVPNRLTFETVLSITIAGVEHEYVCDVSGTFERGYNPVYWGDHPDPGQPDAFDIEGITFTRPDGARISWPLDLLTEAQRDEIEAEGVRVWQAERAEAGR